MEDNIEFAKSENMGKLVRCVIGVVHINTFRGSKKFPNVGGCLKSRPRVGIQG